MPSRPCGRAYAGGRRSTASSADNTRLVPIIVDFVCLERKRIVELDGGQHLEQAGYDQQRSQWLEQRGYRVIRFWDNQVLTQPESVLQAIDNTHDVPPTLARPLRRGGKRCP